MIFSWRGQMKIMRMEVFYLLPQHDWRKEKECQVSWSDNDDDGDVGGAVDGDIYVDGDDDGDGGEEGVTRKRRAISLGLMRGQIFRLD